MGKNSCKNEYIVVSEINMNFLKEIGKTDAWDNSFLEIFLILDKFQSQYQTEDCLVFSNGKFVFFKNKHAYIIEIRKYKKDFHLLEDYQYIFFIKNKFEENLEILKREIKVYLKNTNTDYSMITDKEIIKNIPIKNIQEVLIIQKGVQDK
ncbi:hypothetical protein [Bacillus cereus]|nr:hypothetical protein [Bacillus cereus]